MSNLIANMLNSNSFAERKRITDMFIKYNYEGRLKTFFLPLLRKMTLKERKRFLMLLDNLINKTEYSARDIKFIIKYLDLSQRKVLNDLLLNALFDPASIEGLILWTRAKIEEKDDWQRETFQLDNEVLIDGLTKDLQYPLFSGANDNLERVTLDSTITLDCTVGWTLENYILPNGALSSGTFSGFGLIGSTVNVNDSIYITDIGITIRTTAEGAVSLLTTDIPTQKLSKLTIKSDGTNYYAYIDDVQVATTSIGTHTSLTFNLLGFGFNRVAQGLLYDIKINDVDNSDNWTHHYTGINGDWSDQIKKNQKALFQIDGDKVDLDTSILLDSSVGFRVQFYIKESNSTNSGVLGQDDKNGSGIWFNDIPELRLNDGVNEVTLTHNLSVNTNHLVDIICDTVNIELYVDSVLVDTQPIGSLGVLTIDAIGEGRNIITTGNLWGVKINNLNHTDSWTDQYDGINSDWNNKISSNNGTAGVSLDQTYPIPEDSDNIGFDIDGYPIRELPYYNHGTAGANLKYIKNNHNNLKAKTGGYYVSSLATGDSISIPEITLGEDFTYHIRCELILSVTTPNNLIGKDGSNAHGIWQKNASSVGNWSIRINSVTYDFASIPQGDGEWVDVVITRSGTTTKMYLNGVLHDTITTSDASILIDAISKFNTAYYNGNIKDLALFNTALTASQVANLYNNPQRFVELSREYGAERIYPFMEGNGEVGDSVFDYSGNDQHGTIQSNSAPAGTNFIYNDAEVGMQHTLTGRYVNGSNQFILPVTLTGYLDIAGNAITNKWKQGLLNFTGLDLVDNAHGGVEWGDQVDTLDVSNGRVIAVAFKFNDTGVNQYFIANENTGDGFGLYINGGGKRIVYLNEVGGVNRFLIGTINELIDGNRYKLVVTHFGTTASYYLAEINQSLPSSPTGSASVGVIGLGTVQPTLGIRPSGLTAPQSSLITTEICYDIASITHQEIQNLANYLKSLIS